MAVSRLPRYAGVLQHASGWFGVWLAAAQQQGKIRQVNFGLRKKYLRRDGLRVVITRKGKQQLRRLGLPTLD